MTASAGIPIFWTSSMLLSPAREPDQRAECAAACALVLLSATRVSFSLASHSSFSVVCKIWAISVWPSCLAIGNPEFRFTLLLLVLYVTMRYAPLASLEKQPTESAMAGRKRWYFPARPLELAKRICEDAAVRNNR